MRQQESFLAQVSVTAQTSFCPIKSYTGSRLLGTMWLFRNPAVFILLSSTLLLTFLLLICHLCLPAETLERTDPDGHGVWAPQLVGKRLLWSDLCRHRHPEGQWLVCHNNLVGYFQCINMLLTEQSVFLSLVGWVGPLWGALSIIQNEWKLEISMLCLGLDSRQLKNVCRCMKDKKYPTYSF